MKTVAVMPIKLKNERCPGKNTRLLGDKPLLQYQLNAIADAQIADEIYVFCSDESIIQFLPKNIKFLKRDTKLDLPTSNFTQIFNEFINTVKADIYIYVHATAPFISVKTIQNCYEAVVRGNYDSAFCAQKIQDYLWLNGKPLNFDAKNVPRSQDLTPIYRETSGIYVIPIKTWNKTNQRIGDNPFIADVTFKESIDINNPEDFRLAEIFLNEEE